MSEYKAQLGRSRADHEELARELRQKEQDMDRYKRDSIAESEKVSRPANTSPDTELV